MTENKPFWVGVATIITLCMVSVSMRFLPEAMLNTGSLAPDLPACKGDNCSWQGWLSALSGYFALVAALIGLAITWRGLRHQARQTDFVLGNGQPEFRIISAGNAQQGTRYQIINWNKKQIYIKKFEIKIASPWGVDQNICPTHLVFRSLEKGAKDGPPEELEAGGMDLGIGIKGWLDRQQAPSGWNFSLKMAENNVEEKFDEDEYKIRVYYLVNDDKGRIVQRCIATHVKLRHLLERPKLKKP